MVHLASPPLINDDDGEDAPLGTDPHPEPSPTAMASTVHRRHRTRSQITVLDIDLANALSVAPAPHSWKDAEERVLSEFGGGGFPTPTSAEASSPSRRNGYFVDDPKYVYEMFDKGLLLFRDRSI
jgi:hypothetical protein